MNNRSKRYKEISKNKSTDKKLEIKEIVDLVKKNGVATVDAVEVKEIGREPIKQYMPHHPAADAQGYIYKAAVNVDEEMVDMLEASRQYQNNVEVISTLRALTMRTINIGK